MPERFVELRSKEIQSHAFLELVGRARTQGSVAGLSAAANRIFLDDQAPALIDRYLSHNALRIFMDANALDILSEQIDQQWRHKMMLRYFVRHQASVPMIQAMFPATSRVDINALRAELGAPPPAKASRVSDRELGDLYDAWGQLEHVADDDRQRYIDIHTRFAHLSLTTLFAVLNVGRKAA